MAARNENIEIDRLSATARQSRRPGTGKAPRQAVKQSRQNATIRVTKNNGMTSSGRLKTPNEVVAKIVNKALGITVINIRRCLSI